MNPQLFSYNSLYMIGIKEPIKKRKKRGKFRQFYKELFINEKKGLVLKMLDVIMNASIF